MDRQMLEGLRRFDENVCKNFFEESFDRTVSHLQRSCGLSFEDAEDVASEVVTNFMLRFYQGEYEDVVSKADISKLLSTFARKAAIDFFRKRSAKKRYAIRANIEVDHFEGHRSASTECEEKEIADKLMQAIERLPETYKTVITMQLKGHSNAEIAQLLGEHPNTVANRRSRARDKLKRIFLQLAIRNPFFDSV